MKISLMYYTYKRNIKTNFREEYVNFVDFEKKQKGYFRIIFLFEVIICLFLFFVLFNYNSK